MIKLHPSIRSAQSKERTFLTLRQHYNAIAKEEIPDDLKKLLDKLS